MEDMRSIHLKRLHGQLGDLVYELTRVRFSQFSHPKAWSPAINAYRCGRQMIICVDLAGVDKSLLDLRVETGRLRITGRREPPEPAEVDEGPLQVLAMEIDFGPFEREVALPAQVDPLLIRAEQRDGLLWVFLPFRAQS
jgi:HSP20 family protein